MNERINTALEQFTKTKKAKVAAGLAHRQATQELVSALSDAGVSVDDLQVS